MEQRRLGPDGPPISAIGYGGMHLSIEGRPPEDVGIRVIHAALDQGVTFIDTADVYCLSDRDLGHNERLVAAALESWKGPRETIVVGTKGGMDREGAAWTTNGRPEHLFRACDRSLLALGVERIALYQLHRPDPDVPFTESIEALAELVRRGKVRLLGLSNVSVEQIEQARKITPIATVQNRLSPFFRESLHGGVVEHCGQAGIVFLAYSPTGGGRLNLRIPAIPAVTDLAGRHRVSPHAIVLAWVLAQGPTVVPIPSARKVDHVVDSATAPGVELTADELARLAEAAFPTGR